MDPETVFIPVSKPCPTIRDIDFVRRAVNCYFMCDYKEMKGFILEYGEKEFFEDLVTYFDSSYWRNSNNKYLTFRGIVIAFFDVF
jgi:hypothetical protein